MCVAYFQPNFQIVISGKVFIHFSWKLQYVYGQYRDSWNLRDSNGDWYYRVYSLQWNKH